MTSLKLNHAEYYYIILHALAYRDNINLEEAKPHSLDDMRPRAKGTRSEGIEVRDYFADYPVPRYIVWVPVYTQKNNVLRFYNNASLI